MLWPAWDAPAGYMYGAAGLNRISRINVHDFLASQWVALQRTGPPYTGAFPGLASATPHHSIVNPFSILSRYESALNSEYHAPFRLLLIPCQRPADAISVVGYDLTNPDGGDSALLRSWEDRFGAYLVMLTPDGRIVLAVQDPPGQADQANKLAAEMLAVAAPEDYLPHALDDLTLALLHQYTGADELPATIIGETWGFTLGEQGP